MWYVQYLLMNRHIIKSDLSLDSDEYLDILSVEKAIKFLYNLNLFSDKELMALSTITDMSDIINITIPVVSLSSKMRRQLIDKASNKIAEYLGGYFTNSGYLNDLKIKYNLTDNQINVIERYINSAYKYRILSKPYEGE